MLNCHRDFLSQKGELFMDIVFILLMAGLFGLSWLLVELFERI